MESKITTINEKPVSPGGVLLIVIIMLGIFLIAGVSMSKYVEMTAVEINPTTMNVDTYYFTHDGYIEGNAFFSETEGDNGGSNFFVPYSVTIDGVRYFTYTILNDGAYTNYKKDNQYSQNRVRNYKKINKSFFNEKACNMMRDWADINDINDSSILKYGLK